MIKNVLYYLEQSAVNFPDKTAFADESQELSFSETVDRARRVGSSLAQLKYYRHPIVVRMEKGAEAITAFFGCVYSGNCYVPIDTSVPEKRVEQIIKLLQSEIVITDQKNAGIFEKIEFDGHIFVYEELVNVEVNLTLLEDVRSRTIDTDPLYIIFTSGSTGVPKGVTISHRSTIDFIDHFVETFEITDKDVIANQAPFDFDVSVKDIYTTIKTGATMHIVPKTLFILIPKLMDYLNDKKVTVIIWAVSALTLISNMGGFKRSVPQYLKKVMFSGEVMPTKQLNVWKHYVPNACYVNLYGPTEITCNCLYYIVDRDFEDTEQLPLGSPFDNTEVFLLNEENQIAKDDEIGELCVRGTSLALGYYNNPEATLKAFVQNPLNKNYPELIYRTGDLAQKNVNGELIYSSRRDFQIKHMGHRIELGEIEFAINSLNKIKANVCLYNKKTSKIVCVYQGDNADPKYILEGLKPILPKFMFPHIFIAVDQMPLNKNSKIDRVYLKEKYIDGIN